MDTKKDLSTVIGVIHSYLMTQKIEPEHNSLLIVGADVEDVEIARSLGFTDITTSNIDGFGGHLALDAEAMNLPDDAFDIVFTHAVLHHCQSPHKAVLECVRVCRKNFLFVEPNDSVFMKIATKLKMHEPYEFPAIIAHNYEAGGVRNSAVPNYVYRWSARDLTKTVASGFPEREIDIDICQFFDFFVTRDDLDLRTTTRIPMLTSVLGTDRFISFLRLVQRAANWLPSTRKQGNHFFAGITKRGYQPWIAITDGRPHMRRLDTKAAMSMSEVLAGD